MSRLGKLPVAFDSKVKVSYKGDQLNVKGKLGDMSLTIPKEVSLAVGDNEIKIEADLATSNGKTIAGTIRSIINNMVFGVNEGFVKELEMVGVGYKAAVSGQKLTMALGFSHPVEYQLPKVVKGEVEANTKIKLTSCDKQVLGQTAAEIRKYRPPEPYKGKGILFKNEQIKRKAGKAAKAAT